MVICCAIRLQSNYNGAELLDNYELLPSERFRLNIAPHWRPFGDPWSIGHLSVAIGPPCQMMKKNTTMKWRLGLNSQRTKHFFSFTLLYFSILGLFCLWRGSSQMLFLRSNCGFYQSWHNWTAVKSLLTSKTTITLITNKTLLSGEPETTKRKYLTPKINSLLWIQFS